MRAAILSAGCKVQVHHTNLQHCFIEIMTQKLQCNFRLTFKANLVTILLSLLVALDRYDKLSFNHSDLKIVVHVCIINRHPNSDSLSFGATHHKSI